MARIQINLDCHKEDIQEVLKGMQKAYKNCQAGIQQFNSKIINRDY